MLGKAPRGRRDVAVSLNRTPKYAVMLPQIVELAEAGEGFDRLAPEMKVSRGTDVQQIWENVRAGKPPARRP